jgi:hypothetical protein
LEFDGGELDAVFEGPLLRFHAFNIATDARDPLLHLQDLDDVSGALLKDGAEALFGFAGVFQARNQVGVLPGDFFAGLRFVFDTAEGFQIGSR